jgi:hypothetical protein
MRAAVHAVQMVSVLLAARAGTPVRRARGDEAWDGPARTHIAATDAGSMSLARCPSPALKRGNYIRILQQLGGLGPEGMGGLGPHLAPIAPGPCVF